MDSARPNGRLLLSTPRFDVVEVMQATRLGGNRPRQVILHPGAVVILPMVDDDHVCLIRNERVAVGKTLIELPAGTMEPPATPLQMAVRELKEETGYTAERWREMPAFYMSPGILRERMHSFVAEGLTAGEHAREAGENIDNLVVPWSEAIAMVESGEIEDAKTICALLMWDRLRAR
jgi:ADP-ribose pyrophosphatase